MQPRLNPVAMAVRRAIIDMQIRHARQLSDEEVLEPETKSRFSFFRFWE